MMSPCCGIQPETIHNYVISNHWKLRDNPEHTVEYFRCSNCGSLIMQPLPTAEEMASHFSLTYYRDTALIDEISLSKAPKYDAVLNALSRLCPVPGSLLDVGCAHGYGLDIAGKYGWRPFGIDIDDEVFNYVKDKGYEVVKGCSVSDWVSSEKFDAILYMDALYYFSNPFQELLMANQKLHTGGWLVLRVPLWGPLVSLLERFSNLFGNNKTLHEYARHYLCDHLVVYSQQGFEHSLQAAGFTLYHNAVDWGSGWRASDSLSAIFTRRAREVISSLSSVKITPSMFYIARKING